MFALSMMSRANGWGNDVGTSHFDDMDIHNRMEENEVTGQRMSHPPWYTRRMITMKPYIATFVHKGKRKTGRISVIRTETTVRCDGISDGHAQARAWIKHMDSLVFKNDKDGWQLLELKEL